MITSDNTKKGKAIEHYIISKLLEHDFDVFVPIIDKGIDLIIKDREGGLVEIQVKSRTIEREDYCFAIKSFEPRHNFFIICHNIKENIFFVMPSNLFHRHSTFNKNRGVFELPYSKLKNSYACYSNDKGLEFLRKALESKSNRINLFLEE